MSTEPCRGCDEPLVRFGVHAADNTELMPVAWDFTVRGYWCVPCAAERDPSRRGRSLFAGADGEAGPT